MNFSEERRTKRSSDPLVALHYQLSTARREGALDAIVLADTSGVVVAGAGSWPVCEELAAYAPLLLQKDLDAPGLSLRVDTLRREVNVQTMHVDGQEVLLCTRGGQLRGESVDRAARGVERILTAA